MSVFKDRLATAIAERDQQLAKEEVAKRRTARKLVREERCRFNESKWRLLNSIPASRKGDMISVLPLRTSDGLSPAMTAMDAGRHTPKNLAAGTAAYAMAELMFRLGHAWGISYVRPENPHDALRLGIKLDNAYLHNGDFVLMLYVVLVR